MNGLISYLSESDVAVARLDLFCPTILGGGGLLPVRVSLWIHHPYNYRAVLGLNKLVV